jgi:hypothetical protein
LKEPVTGPQAGEKEVAPAKVTLSCGTGGLHREFDESRPAFMTGAADASRAFAPAQEALVANPAFPAERQCRASAVFLFPDERKLLVPA